MPPDISQALIAAIQGLERSQPAKPSSPKTDSGSAASSLAGGVSQVGQGVAPPAPTVQQGADAVGAGVAPPTIPGHDPSIHPPVDHLLEAHDVAQALEHHLSGGTTPTITTPTLQDLLDGYKHITDLHNHGQNGGSFDGLSTAFTPQSFNTGATTPPPAVDPGMSSKDTEMQAASSLAGTPTPVDPNSPQQLRTDIDNAESNPTPLPKAEHAKLPILLQLALLAAGTIGNRIKGNPNAGSRFIEGITQGLQKRADQKTQDNNQKYQQAEQKRQATIQAAKTKLGYVEFDAKTKAEKDQQDTENALAKRRVDIEEANRKGVISDRQMGEMEKLLSPPAGTKLPDMEARMLALDKTDYKLSDEQKHLIRDSFKHQEEREYAQKTRVANQKSIDKSWQEAGNISKGGKYRTSQIDHALSMLDPTDPQDKQQIDALNDMRADASKQTETEKLIASRLNGQNRKNQMTGEQIALLADKVKWFDRDEQAKMANLYSQVDDRSNKQLESYAKYQQSLKEDDFKQSRDLWDKAQGSRKSALTNVVHRLNELRRSQAQLGDNAPQELNSRIKGLEGEANRLQTEVERGAMPISADNPIGSPMKQGGSDYGGPKQHTALDTPVGDPADEMAKAQAAIKRHPGKKDVIIATYEARTRKKWSGG